MGRERCLGLGKGGVNSGGDYFRVWITCGNHPDDFVQHKFMSQSLGLEVITEVMRMSERDSRAALSSIVAI